MQFNIRDYDQVMDELRPIIYNKGCNVTVVEMNDPMVKVEIQGAQDMKLTSKIEQNSIK